MSDNNDLSRRLAATIGVTETELDSMAEAAKIAATHYRPLLIEASRAIRELNARAEAAEAEVERLKGVLDALSAVRSDLPEKVSEGWLYEGVRHWHRNCDWDDPTDGAPLDRGDGATVAKLINMIPRKALAGETT